MKQPKCFISYSWDSDDHKEWVRNLATQLQNNGVDTYLDQWDLRAGMNLPHYMENSIRESDFVLLVCTPIFAEKANTERGGVGWEKRIVTGETYDRTSPETKFVPIIRSGSPENSLASYLKSKIYIDFRDDSRFHSNLEQLLRHIYEAPIFERPAPGPRPAFASSTQNQIVPSSQSPNGLLLSEISTLAGDWVRQNHHSYMVEGLSEKQKAFVRHPPNTVEIDDFQLLLFLMRAGLHYGGNWPFWVSKCKNLPAASNLLINAVGQSYDRVRLRALYALQFTKNNDLQLALDKEDVRIPGDLRNIISTLVANGRVIDYVNEIASSSDRDIATKAASVIREISQFGHILA